MRIAVLGWGSLVWDPKTLVEHLVGADLGAWATDGPLLPVEFARASDEGKGRLSLVIVPSMPLVQVLWNVMQTQNLDVAIRELRHRERTSTKKIGYINLITGNFECQHGQPIIELIQKWVKAKEVFDAVIWTDLESNFSEVQKRELSETTAVAYVQSLTGDTYIEAKNYILKAPAQVQTMFRPALERALLVDV